MTDQPQGATLTATPAETVSWLPIIQRRIRDSILPPDLTETDGCYLTREIAAAGTDFFATTAAVLPGEPYLDSTYQGDLVAEFSAAHGNLTAIVSTEFVLLFAATKKMCITRRVGRGEDVVTEVAQLARIIK